MLKNFFFKDVIVSKKKILDDLVFLEQDINKIIKKIYITLKKGNKILICGNGGSAADAQHLAAEFLVRLRPKINRKPYPVLSLALDTSTITACGNDFDFHDLFKRNFEALYKPKDLLIVISTSGNSQNIVNVLKFAKSKKIFSIGFLGIGGGRAKKFCDASLLVPSNNVARIQECHIFIGHYIFEAVENLLIQKNK